MHLDEPTDSGAARANLYALVAGLLLAPDAALVRGVAAAPRSEEAGRLAEAWNGLVDAAARLGAAVLAEHQALFVACGTPALNPYECRYAAGWLMDKPLALLRTDLGKLGCVRADGATELEDHLGALCETMALLARRGDPPHVQHAFFERHLANWAPACFSDIRGAGGADFYAHLADFAEAFFEEEREVLVAATEGATA